jgi:glycosyltransferase involved in cell wall biosynthesis
VAGWGVTVVTARLTRPRSAINMVRALATGRPLQALYCWEPALAGQLSRTASLPGAPFEAAHIEHLRGVEFGLALRKAQPGLPTVWDSVDCISGLFEQAARASRSRFGRWVTRLELPRTRRYEARAVHAFHRVLATTSREAAALERLGETVSRRAGSDGRVEALPNGVDLEHFAPGAGPRQPATVVLTGKMSYHANVTAAHQLVTHIMPHVWASHPEVRVRIVGSQPPADVRALAERHAPLVSVAGYVPDLRPDLQTATVAVAPMAYSAGIQNKVLEAMACGAPVVASPPAVAALQTRPGEDVLVAEDAPAFAGAICRVVDDPALARRVGDAGRRYVAAFHDWTVVAKRLQDIYQEVASG